MTNADIIVNLATIIADQRLEISELKTEVQHLHHELLAMMVESDTPQTEEDTDCTHVEQTERPCDDCIDFNCVGYGCDKTDCGWGEPK